MKILSHYLLEYLLSHCLLSFGTLVGLCFLISSSFHLCFLACTLNGFFPALSLLILFYSNLFFVVVVVVLWEFDFNSVNIFHFWKLSLYLLKMFNHSFIFCQIFWPLFYFCCIKNSIGCFLKTMLNFKNNFIYLFLFGCAGCLLLHTGFL